jgi:5-methylcytosine-specific restriction endonuclease McrA
MNSRNWKHQGLRKIPIPKKDGTTRMLKIPTIADRAWQCLAKYALELAHEATFHSRSYGFRTGRSAHEAQQQIRNNLKANANGIDKRVIELDIESQKKTKITASTDGFDFLGWHFKVQSNGKFRCTPSTDNFKAFRKKVKAIVNNSNYGAKEKAQRLSPLVRGWRNYHCYCKMNGSRFSLVHIETRAYRVFNKESKQDRHSAKKLLDKAFPKVSYIQGKYVMVAGEKSPYDGDLTYWSKRNSKLYDGYTSKALTKQSHKCASCGLKFIDEERVHLHHIDGNHANWKKNNLEAIHESCHDYKHMSKTER